MIMRAHCQNKPYVLSAVTSPLVTLPCRLTFQCIYNHLQQILSEPSWLNWQRVRFLGERFRVQDLAGAKKNEFFGTLKSFASNDFQFASNDVIQKNSFCSHFVEMTSYLQSSQKYLSYKLLINTFPTFHTFHTQLTGIKEVQRNQPTNFNFVAFLSTKLIFVGQFLLYPL